jgi:TIR domain
MKVFVSWSGQKSRDVARAFGDWLPLVLHAVEPFVSSKDIRAGTRWQAEIAKELDDTDFGLICVTRENQRAEWLNFEAGALAKSVNSSRVVPLAIDLSPADIASPLGQFQAMKLTKDDIGEVLASMNEACPSPIEEGNLRKAVGKWWPDLQEELAKIEHRDYGDEGATPSPARTDRELIEELLDSVRGLGRAPVAVPRVPESEMERTEEAIRDFEAVVFGGDYRLKSMSTAINGNVISIEMSPDPTPELRKSATAIGFLHGVRFHLAGTKGSEKAAPGPAGAE